jgi:hypothetical protein
MNFSFMVLCKYIAIDIDDQVFVMIIVKYCYHFYPHDCEH